MGNNKRHSLFRFKRFDCLHGSGSMKIGVDAVLIGAWTDVSDADRILDVGTGCGVIALMCAQRNSSSKIIAIDIDEDSVNEAALNFRSSEWHDRLEARLEDFNLINLNNIDLIISNPPYFISGIDHPDTPRLVARHADGLSPAVLLRRGASMLSHKGRISMIVPFEQMDSLISEAVTAGLGVRRICLVKGHPDAPVKRAMMEFMKNPDRAISPDPDLLVLEYSPGVPTESHRKLCKDFYLKF